MTFRELVQIEKYIQEINNIKRLSISGDELRVRSNILNGQISSSVKGYAPKGINWNDAWVWDKYPKGHYDVEKCKAILDIMQAALQGILNSLPYYDEVCDLGKDISYGRNISSSAKSKSDFIVEMVKKYSRNIKFEQPIINVRDSILAGNVLSEEQLDFVFRTLLLDMEEYRKSLFDDKRDLKEAVNTPVLVKVAQTQNNSQVQNVATDLNVSIQDCLKDLDDCETLNEQEKEDIKAQLEEIKQLLEDKRGKKKTIRGKISSILKWVADKSTDAMIAVLPTLITTLNLIK